MGHVNILNSNITNVQVTDNGTFILFNPYDKIMAQIENVSFENVTNANQGLN